MDTLRSIMKKVDALTNELATVKAQNRELSKAVKLIKEKALVLPTKQVKQLKITDVDKFVSEKIASIKQQKHITANDVAVIVDDKISKIKPLNTLTSNDVILNIKNVVNLDYVNNLYRK
mgnify:CR=1 FL=1